MLDDLFEIFGNHKRRYGHGHGHGHGDDHGYEDDHRHGNYNDGYARNQENRNDNNVPVNPNGSVNAQDSRNVDSAPFNRGYRQQYGQDLFDPRMILSKVLQNKQLLIGLAVAAIFLFVLVVAAFFMLLPILFKMLAVLEKNGLKGVFDSVLPILTKIWEGKEALAGK
jgi:hypothetical protein